MVKSPIKIPKLYPTETVEIEGNKIELRGYKAGDRPYVILIEQIQLDMNPILKEIGEFQVEIMALIQDDTGKQFTDEELKEAGTLDRVLEITDQVNALKLKVDEVSDRLIFGDSESDEMEGPGYLLAQRGLKRFFYKDCPEFKEAKREDRLIEYIDSLPDIEIARQHVMLVANTMISLSNPPKGLQKSIEDRMREDEKAAGKGKSPKGKRISRSKKK